MFAAAAAAQTWLVVYGGTWWQALALGTLTGVLLSLIIALLAVRPFLSHAGHASATGWLLGTLASAIVVRSMLEHLWGQEEKPLPLFAFGGTHYYQAAQGSDLSIFAGSLLIFTVVMLFYKSRKFELGIRCTYESIERSQLVGINTSGLFYLTYFLAGVVAGLGGTLMAQRTLVSPWLGPPLAVKAFAIAVLCKMMPSYMAILWGLAMAGVEMLCGFFLVPGLAHLPGPMLATLLLVIFPKRYSLREATTRL